MGLYPLCKTRYPFSLHDAVKNEFIWHALDLVDANRGKFKGNKTAQRRFWSGVKDARIDRAKEELAEHFGFSEWRQEPTFEDYFGYITAPGFIHQHTDPELPRHRHVRINVNLSCPESGGLPTNDDIACQVAMGDAYITFASLVRHGSTRVAGNIPRITLSLGFQVPMKIIDEQHMPIYRAWREEQG